MELNLEWRKVCYFECAEFAAKRKWPNPAQREGAGKRLRNLTAAHVCITTDLSQEVQTLKKLVKAFGDPGIAKQTNRTNALELCRHLDGYGLIKLHRLSDDHKKYTATRFQGKMLKAFAPLISDLQSGGTDK